MVFIWYIYFYVYAYPPLDRGSPCLGTSQLFRLVIQMFRCPCEESAVMPGIVKWQWWCLVSGTNSTTFGMWTIESDHHSFCLPNCFHHNVCCFHFHFHCAKCCCNNSNPVQAAKIGLPVPVPPSRVGNPQVVALRFLLWILSPPGRLYCRW